MSRFRTRPRFGKGWEEEHEATNGSFVYINQPTFTSGGVNNNINMYETSLRNYHFRIKRIIFSEDHEKVQMCMRIDRILLLDKSNLAFLFVFSPMMISNFQKKQSGKNYIFQKRLGY